MREPRRAAIALAILAGALLGLVVQFIPITPPVASALAVVEGEMPEPENDSGWKRDAERMPPGMVRMYRELPRYVSFTRGVEWTGDIATGWLRAAPRVALMVAGNPAASGNRLSLETRAHDGSIKEIVFPGPDSGGYWIERSAHLPDDAEAVRVRGHDGTSDGWVGFAIPGAVNWPLTFDLKMVLQTIGTSMLAAVLLVGPGLLLRVARRCAFVDIIWPGPWFSRLADWSRGRWEASSHRDSWRQHGARRRWCSPLR